MPAYSTVAAFLASPVGQQAASLIDTTPPEGQAAVASTLFQASSEADSITGRVLGAPPATTFSGSVSVGARSAQVADVGNIGPGDVLVTAHETLTVIGADPTDTALSGNPPYAGAVTFAKPTTASYTNGDAVTAYRQSRVRIRGKGTRANDGDTGFITQESQIAEMLSPRIGRATSSRYVFLPNRPIWSVLTAYQALPWTSGEAAVDLGSVEVDTERGFLLLPYGIYNPIDSRWRVQYVGGFVTIPRDIQQAVHLLMADIIARAANAFGATSIKTGEQSVTFGSGVSVLRQQACDILERYCATGLV